MNLICDNCDFFTPVEGRSRGRCASPAIVGSYGKDREFYPPVDKDSWCAVHEPKDDKNAQKT